MNLYQYVKNSPVNFVDPLGLIWVTVGYDNHKTGNYFHYLWNRFWQGFDKELNTQNLSNLARDIIQEWQHDPNNPCRDKEYPLGTRRIIPQTIIEYINQGPATNLINDPEATFYYQWTPWVDSSTYNNYPNTTYENVFYWQQGQ